MDSLKLDRFRKLLNRQNISINACDGLSATNPQPPTTLSSSSGKTTTTSSLPAIAPILSSTFGDKLTANKSNLLATNISMPINLPLYVTKDNPRPAVFIARKLFSDFIELTTNKIEIILNRDSQTTVRPIFKPLELGQDLIYDQVIEGLGEISEYCLPSLLNLIIAWYHYQLDIEDGFNSSSLNQSSQHQKPLQFQENSLQTQNEPFSLNEQEMSFSECCGSPSCQTDSQMSNFINQSPRSPAPTTPDMNYNQIISPLPSENTIPASGATNANPSDNQQQQSNNSAANTSNSTTATNVSNNSIILDDAANTLKRLELIKARSLLVEFAFCRALIEIFSKLYLHPGLDDLILQIEEIAFRNFKYLDRRQQEQQLHGIELDDINGLADKYAEVIGVLAKTRLNMIKKRFLSELNELRSSEPTPSNIQSIVTLLSSMKSFRVKMAPIEEFESSFQLLQELADYFVAVRHKSIRHALAELFAEIMLPLATTVKNEVKIPCLKNFVDTLWLPTLEMCNRKKHSSTLFPLVTCLLCLSQRSLFLQNWSHFLNMCQSNLKNRDSKMSRIALDSLYRLIWMYMIRIKCESNNVTQTRLNSIVESLFPKGSRQVVPRDAPLSIFVDILHFIAQERLDFAMRHIIFELLSVDRSSKLIIAPERMTIGLNAFLIIADSLQQKESEPMMSIKIGTASPHSSNFHDHENNNRALIGTRRPHGNGNHRMLNDESAKSIGLHPYYSNIQKSFNEILKCLDTQFGKPLMLTCFPNATAKELGDMLSSDRKPKLELFKTCIAAIPRIMPDGLSKTELIDLLSRMTIHLDEEMRRNAFEALQILVIEFQDWRLDAISGYTIFLANQIDESLKHLIDSTLRMLLQLLISWRNLITSSSSSSSSTISCSNFLSSNSSNRTSVVNIQTGYETISSRNSGAACGQIAARKNRALAEMRLIQSELSNTRFDRLVNVIQKVEGASLVMLCSYHHQTRRLASHLLRECRTILKCYSSWTCMEQFGFKSPDEVDCGDGDDFSESLKGSLSADNLSRITTTSMNGPAHSSVTSMNTQATLSTSVSKLCISASQQQSINLSHKQHQQQQLYGFNGNQQQQQHDLYDEDIENNLGDCYTSDDSPTLIFWIAIMMLESEREQEYTFALRLLRKILPNMPFEQQDFVDELERTLKQLDWQDSFTGIHALVLKGCPSQTTYDLCISLLDHLTPILKQRICTSNSRGFEDCLPFHVLVLSTFLLSTYEDPSPFSLNIARRLALCCEENSLKLENLSAVMTLYSRRSFSKDAFQWIKCVTKYLNDACPKVVPKTIPLLIDLLESAPLHIQRLILPIIYCILTYIDISSQQPASNFNSSLLRIYAKCLGSTPQTSTCNSNNNHAAQQSSLSSLWRDAVQIFKLIISRSSSLSIATSTSTTSYSLTGNSGSSSAFHSLTIPSSIQSSSGFTSLSSSVCASGRGGLELPGRTMEFTMDIESLPLIGKSRLIELGANLSSSSASSSFQRD